MSCMVLCGERGSLCCRAHLKACTLPLRPCLVGLSAVKCFSNLPVSLHDSLVFLFPCLFFPKPCHDQFVVYVHYHFKVGMNHT